MDLWRRIRGCCENGQANSFRKQKIAILFENARRSKVYLYTLDRRAFSKGNESRNIWVYGTWMGIRYTGPGWVYEAYGTRDLDGYTRHTVHGTYGTRDIRYTGPGWVYEILSESIIAGYSDQKLFGTQYFQKVFEYFLKVLSRGIRIKTIRDLAFSTKPFFGT